MLPGGVRENLRLTFGPHQREEDGLNVGEKVCIALDERHIRHTTGLPLSSAWLPHTHRFTVTAYAVELRVDFEGHPADTQFQLLFDGIAAQPMKHRSHSSQLARTARRARRLTPNDALR